MTDTVTNTYRLGSCPLIFAPGVIRAAIVQYAHDRDWSMRVLTEGWSLPAAAAEALLSKEVPYTVEAEAVVFTVEAAGDAA